MLVLSWGIFVVKLRNWGLYFKYVLNNVFLMPCDVWDYCLDICIDNRAPLSGQIRDRVILLIAELYRRVEHIKVLRMVGDYVFIICGFIVTHT